MVAFGGYSQMMLWNTSYNIPDSKHLAARELAASSENITAYKEMHGQQTSQNSEIASNYN